MKKTLILILILIFNIFGQWSQVSGPNGSIYAILKNGNTLIVGSGSAGVHFSTDLGVSWNSNNSGLGSILDIRSLAKLDNKIFAGTYGGGLYVSTNNGINWSKVAGNLPSGITVRGIFVDGDTIFVCTNSVYRSTNKGVNWTLTGTGIPANVNSIIKFGNKLLAVTDNGIVASTNNGGNWTKSDSGLPGTSGKYVMDIIAKGNNLFCIYSAGSGSGKIYKSIDGGNIWSKSDSGITNNLTKFCVHGNDLLVASNNAGLFRSTNDGFTWQKITNQPSNLYVNTIISDGVNIFAGGNSGQFAGNGGFFVSADNGNNWNRTTTDISNGTVRSFASIGNKVFAGVTWINSTNSGGVFISNDNGISWKKPLSIGWESYSVYNLFAIGNNLFASAEDNVGRAVYLSTNFGDNWTSIKNGLWEYSKITGFVAEGNNLFCGIADGGFNAHYGGVYLTTDNGTNWIKKNSGFPSEVDIKSIAIIPGKLIAANSSNKIYTSINNGDSWTAVTYTGLPANVYIDKLFYAGNNLYTPTLYNGLFKSIDGGSTWSAINNNLSSAGLILSFINYQNTIFVGSSYTGVFKSTDEGTNWTAVNTGFNQSLPYCYALLVNNYQMFMGTGNAIWKRDMHDLVDVKENQNSEQPAKFELYQNYPNPFNPSTTISFSIPENSLVELKVFDVLGNEVETLINKILNKGNHKIHLDGSRLSSGVYFYQLKSTFINNEIKNSSTQIKKLILVK